MEQLFPQENRNQASYQLLGGKAWTVYIGFTVACGIVLLADLLLGHLHSLPWQIELAIAVVAIITLTTGIALIRATRLYCDDQGIWCFQGILPWKRGVTGLRWENLDKVGYETNFAAWFTRSYTITLYHRYTGDSNIQLTHIWKGREAVQKINQGFEQWQQRRSNPRAPWLGKSRR